MFGTAEINSSVSHRRWWISFYATRKVTVSRTLIVLFTPRAWVSWGGGREIYSRRTWRCSASPRRPLWRSWRGGPSWYQIRHIKVTGASANDGLSVCVCLFMILANLFFTFGNKKFKFVGNFCDFME